MAYMCVLASNHECDGCQECEDTNKQYDPRWDCEYDHDEEYCRYLEREDNNYDC